MRFRTMYKRSDYFFRHFQSFLPYFTLLKTANLLLNIIEMKFRISMPLSLPPYIKVEPTVLCHLKCPGCPQEFNRYKTQHRENLFLTLQHFKKIIDPLSHTLLGISLSVHGEPMLNKNIVSLIEYAHSKNIAVHFPTNLSIKLSNEQIEQIVRSGLDSIEVSLDGVSEETYGKYRIGGIFSLVLHNVRWLSEVKRKLGTNRPKIIWKFIVFEHNKHEAQSVIEQYKSLGFNAYKFIYDIRSDEATTARNDFRKTLQEPGRGCYWLWHAMIIHWDGTVVPCCSSDRRHINLGNAIHEDSKQIWRCEKYKSLREGFSKQGYGDKMHTMCKKCIGIA